MHWKTKPQNTDFILANVFWMVFMAFLGGCSTPGHFFRPFNPKTQVEEKIYLSEAEVTSPFPQRIDPSQIRVLVGWIGFQNSDEMILRTTVENKTAAKWILSLGDQQLLFASAGKEYRIRSRPSARDESKIANPTVEILAGQTRTADLLFKLPTEFTASEFVQALENDRSETHLAFQFSGVVSFLFPENPNTAGRKISFVKWFKKAQPTENERMVNQDLIRELHDWRARETIRNTGFLVPTGPVPQPNVYDSHLKDRDPRFYRK